VKKIVLLSLVAFSGYGQNCTLQNPQTYSSAYEDLIFEIAISPDGKQLALLGGQPYAINLFDIHNGALSNSRNIPLPKPAFMPSGMVFSPDSKYLITADSFYKALSVFKNDNGTLKHSADYHHFDGEKEIYPSTLTFSPDGNYLLIAVLLNDSHGDIKRVIYTLSFSNGTLTLVETTTLFDCYNDYITGITFTPNGQFLIVSGACVPNAPHTTYSLIGVAQFDQGSVIPQATYHLPNNGNWPRSTAISPDGSYLATANDYSRDVSLFEIATDGTLHNGTSYTPYPFAYVASVIFSPDSRSLIINLDNKLQILDLETGSTVMYSLPYDLATMSGFSPDGTSIGICNSVRSVNVTMFTAAGCS